MEIFLTFVKVFVVGGLFCVVGQLLLAKTMLTTGRILAIFVVAGVVLTAAHWVSSASALPAEDRSCSGSAPSIRDTTPSMRRRSSSDSGCRGMSRSTYSR